MSISSPQNRDEFRQYILTKLGAPVIEINVADEQIDIAIDDAFQYFNERSHFLGTENMYLTTRITPEFTAAFSSFTLKQTSQEGKGDVPIPGRPTSSARGMVAELTLISTGSGYPPNRIKQQNVPTQVENNPELTNEAGSDLQSDAGDDLIYEGNATGDSKGSGLTVTIGSQRTTQNGITNVSIRATGTDYEVGDVIAVTNTSNNIPGFTPALFEVSKVKTESPVFGTADITIQNNYLVLPDDVVGVNGVLKSVNSDLVGIFPGGSVFPILLGGVLGNDFACGDQGYNLVSYVAMREYMATIEFLFFPPVQYSFNQRTHRLFIDSNNFKAGDTGAYGVNGKILAIDCMVKPSPDVYPDLFNDLWLKEYAVALVRCQWGRNLTKFQQVQLPGGITMNGEQILATGREDLKELRSRFAMDWADPPLDEVG